MYSADCRLVDSETHGLVDSWTCGLTDLQFYGWNALFFVNAACATVLEQTSFPKSMAMKSM